MLQSRTRAGASLGSSGSVAPLVSIIIPSKNSDDTMVECLTSVISQSYRPIEIIVIDDFSTDSTKEIAESMGSFVVSHGGERSSAKNLGASLARGEYLYFVNADHKLGPDAITSCLESIDGADGVVIRDQDIPRDTMVSRLVASRRRILSCDPLNVATRFVRKDTFHRLGGFDSNLYVGEDLDFHKRLLRSGFKLANSRATEWHLGPPVDWTGLLKRNLYYSQNYPKYVSKNPLISLKRLNPFRTVSGWKNSVTRDSDLLPIVLLGFLSDVFLVIGLMLSVTARNTSATTLSQFRRRFGPTSRYVG